MIAVSFITSSPVLSTMRDPRVDVWGNVLTWLQCICLIISVVIVVVLSIISYPHFKYWLHSIHELYKMCFGHRSIQSYLESWADKVVLHSFPCYGKYFRLYRPKGMFYTAIADFMERSATDNTSRGVSLCSNKMVHWWLLRLHKY